MDKYEEWAMKAESIRIQRKEEEKEFYGMDDAARHKQVEKLHEQAKMKIEDTLRIVSEEGLVHPKCLKSWKELLEQYLEYRTHTESDLERFDIMTEALRRGKTITSDRYEERENAYKAIFYEFRANDDDVLVALLDYSPIGKEYALYAYKEMYGHEPTQATKSVVSRRHRDYINKTAENDDRDEI